MNITKQYKTRIRIIPEMFPAPHRYPMDYRQIEEIMGDVINELALIKRRNLKHSEIIL
jgi:hypothetical protein